MQNIVEILKRKLNFVVKSFLINFVNLWKFTTFFNSAVVDASSQIMKIFVLLKSAIFASFKLLKMQHAQSAVTLS